MALPDDSSRHPLMAYNFRVTIAAKTIGWKEVSGLARQHETLSYQHGLSFREGERLVKYRLDKHAPITLKKATVTLESMVLYAWLETKIELPMEISLCNARGVALVSWRIERAIPVKLTGATFDAASNEISIDTFEVMAAGISVAALAAARPLET